MSISTNIHRPNVCDPLGTCISLVINYIGSIDGYYVAYKSVTLSSILFMFIKMKFIHCHFCEIYCNEVHEHMQ